MNIFKLLLFRYGLFGKKICEFFVLFITGLLGCGNKHTSLYKNGPCALNLNENNVVSGSVVLCTL